MPSSISQYVLKVHSRCNLSCDHCYVYEHADQSWSRKPHAIAPSTVDSAAARIAEHARTHRLPQVRIVLHGGEPLLLGLKGMRAVIETLVARISPVTAVDLLIQTNGVRLNEEWCTLFSQYKVHVGISMDGDQVANDRHRRFVNGESSYAQARRALSLLRRPEHRELYSGILCTIDVENDPISVYEALIAEEPPTLDLLLPHATWANPPKRPAGATAPYAAWLTRIYRRWIGDGRPVPIRVFDSLLSAASGGPSLTETLGLEPVDLLVIDTDGSWEQPDSLKTAFDGAPATGMAVFSHPVDAVITQPGFVSRLGGLTALCGTCQDCEFVRTCGGGLYAHRYRPGNGFDNPTVYCADMKQLIGQISARPPPTSRPASAPAAMHELPAGAFDALAAGPGNPAAMAALTDMELSLTRRLVAAVARADGSWQDKNLRRCMEEGWALLCSLDSAHREQVSQVLGHPFVRAWAEKCLRPSAGSDRDLDRAHLAGLAAAAAVRAGVGQQLLLPVRNGRVYLPTVGAMKLSSAHGRSVSVSAAAGRVRADGRAGTWLPARQTTAGALAVTLEDLDPFRACYERPVAARLTPAQWRSWDRNLNASARRLSAALPDYASVLATGLRTVVPLRRTAGHNHGATARQAFGSVGLAPARRPGDLDTLLLHEFQHTKLHALIDLHDLFDRASPVRIAVPWRADPRPVEGVLHGTYAYLALTHLSLSEGLAGHDRHDRYRAWVAGVADRLAKADVLTRAGQRFVTGMCAAAEL
ncbi:MAG TPA: FxsB family cyclophane-forming radical SAM/SPASM peptide maturase [Streptosporangiaceae bacterium]|nr:FxsB family cyclophane-forming radical SAM/SPASM peptide maturase [Streptosporangiaceae bacterium]